MNFCVRLLVPQFLFSFSGEGLRKPHPLPGFNQGQEHYLVASHAPAWFSKREQG